MYQDLMAAGNRKSTSQLLKGEKKEMLLSYVKVP